MSQFPQKQLTWTNTTNNLNSSNNMFNMNAPSNNLMQNQTLASNQNNMGFFGNLALGPPLASNTMMPKMNSTTKPNVNQFGNMKGLISTTAKGNDRNKKSALDDLDDLFG